MYQILLFFLVEKCICTCTNIYLITLNMNIVTKLLLKTLILYFTIVSNHIWIFVLGWYKHNDIMYSYYLCVVYFKKAF